MAVICTILLDISIPGIKSLKEKRGFIKPIIHRLHRRFNISVSEVDFQDIWDRSVLLCALVSNDGSYAQSQAMQLINYFKSNFRDVYLLSHRVEFV
jgi:uncharacterized protein YlxP (DUF503 family)